MRRFWISFVNTSLFGLVYFGLVYAELSVDLLVYLQGLFPGAPWLPKQDGKSFQFVLLIVSLLLALGLFHLVEHFVRARFLRLIPNLAKLNSEIAWSVGRHYLEALKTPPPAAQSNQNTHVEYHRRQISEICHQICEGLRAGYKNTSTLSATVMFPGQLASDDEEKLYIEFWWNKDNEIPATRNKDGEGNRRGFAKGEGFCGTVWKWESAIAGGKRARGIPFVKRLWFLPIGRKIYVNTSRRQESVKSFLSIYVSQNFDGVGDLAFILNLDCEEKKYFPATHRHLRQLQDSLKPLNYAMLQHIYEYINLSRE